MSKIFGEEHFIEQDMVSIVYSEVSNKIDKMVFDKMQQTIHCQFPEIKINEDKLRKWVLLCNNLENIEYSELVDIATQKKLSNLKQQLEEKNKEIERLDSICSDLFNTRETEYEKLKTIRKQVCDEIREKLENDFEYDCEYTYGKLSEILDQVEKGE